MKMCRAVVPATFRNLLILWSGRPGSNRRRPAWEKVRQLYLKHLFVSETLIRLTQALAVSTTSFLQPSNRGTNEVHPNVLLASINCQTSLGPETTMARAVTRAINPEG